MIIWLKELQMLFVQQKKISNYIMLSCVQYLHKIFKDYKKKFKIAIQLNLNN